MKANADLHFGPDVSGSGFTPAGIAGFSDLRPSAVVRELIQNSLDAALIEASEPCARVRFRRYKCNLKEIPGIKSYKSAFRRAVEAQTRLGRQMPTQAQLVVDRISNALSRSSQQVLSITDNGVGLNEQRMSALLSDGVSAKSDKSAGTFGNGHSVAIPASNLRYLLYGGISDDGQTLGAGHAVLASHSVPKETYARSAHGLYVKAFKSSKDRLPYTFAAGVDLPDMIASEVRRVKEAHGHGTTVLIPAFNNFEDDRSLWDMVSSAAACNFFPAIYDGLLIVEVEDLEESSPHEVTSHEVQVLNAKTLPAILNNYKDQQRIGRRGAFVSGRKANDAFRAVVDGDVCSVATSQGDVVVKLLVQDTGKQEVCLCRNGMWITDSLPRFQTDFSDRQPFQALILLDPNRRNNFYKLIQEAETPLHDRLALKQMPRERQRELREALGEIRDWIRTRVPEAKTESYSPEDVLAFQFSGPEARGPGGRRASFWGTPVTSRGPRPIQPPAKDDSGDDPKMNKEGHSDKQRRRTKNPKERKVAMPFFRIVSVPDAPGKQTIHIECERECDDAELRVFIDENIDATCDRQAPAQVAPLLLSDVSIDGKILSDNAIIHSDQRLTGVRLGRLTADSATVVTIGYTVPNDFVRLLPGQNPTLRVEIGNRTISTQTTEPENDKVKDHSDA